MNLHVKRQKDPLDFLWTQLLGIQNGITRRCLSLPICTTHFTGYLTDVGTGFGLWARETMDGNKQPTLLKAERGVNLTVTSPVSKLLGNLYQSSHLSRLVPGQENGLNEIRLIFWLSMRLDLENLMLKIPRHICSLILGQHAPLVYLLVKNLCFSCNFR